MGHRAGLFTTEKMIAVTKKITAIVKANTGFGLLNPIGSYPIMLSAMISSDGECKMGE